MRVPVLGRAPGPRRVRAAGRLLAGLMLAAGPAAAQQPADSAAIRATVEDYLLGWYDGDAARMERALHPELAKRQVVTGATGRSRLEHLGALGLVQRTRRRAGTPQPRGERRLEISILDLTGTTASVKSVAWDFFDHLHLARSDGRWVIVNVLWDTTEPPERRSP